MNSKTILIISISLLLLIGCIVGFTYYSVLKKRKAQKLFTATTAAAAATFVAAETMPPAPPITITPPVPAASNVIVSTVEEIHNTVSEEEIYSTFATPNRVQNEKIDVEKSPSVILESDIHIPISPEISQEAKNMISPPPAELAAMPVNIATPLGATTLTEEKKEAPLFVIENPVPETPAKEKTTGDTFLTPPTPPESTRIAPIEPIKTPLLASPETHPLFAGILDAVDPKKDTPQDSPKTNNV